MSGHQTRSHETEVTVLMDRLCADWGFCLSPDATANISRRDKLDAHEFAVLVLSAEGLTEPESELHWIRRIRARFVEHFGRETIFATDDPVVMRDSDS